MASQSPGLESTEIEDYRQSWGQVSQAMNDGKSWSGHERHSAWVQTTDGRFVQVAGALGMDYDQDGRSMATVDWDGDGDLDLFLRNRTAPGLRYLENQSTGPRLALRVETEFSKKQGAGADLERDLEQDLERSIDAIGARVLIQTSQRQWMHEVRAGGGYLAQSQPLVVQHLRPKESIQQIRIAWPDGSSLSLNGPDVAAEASAPILRVRPDGVVSLAAPPRNAPGLAAALEATPLAQRIVLRSAVPLPRGAIPEVDLFESDWKPGRAQLLVLQGSQPLDMAAWKALYRSASIENQIPLTVWASADKAEGEVDEAWIQRGLSESAAALQTVIAHCVEHGPHPNSPAALLLDMQANLQVIYWGPPDPEQLEKDWAQFLSGSLQGAERGAFPGRWFHGSQRDWKSLAIALHEQGHKGWAGFYARLAQR